MLTDGSKGMNRIFVSGSEQMHGRFVSISTVDLARLRSGNMRLKLSKHVRSRWRFR